MEQEQTKPAIPELTVTDLVNLRSVVDVAVRRGTFGANEISSVGAVFDKLNSFLNAVTTAQKTEENTAKEGEPTQ